MKVTELTRDQLVQLKQGYFCGRPEEPSWEELAQADTLITDEEIFSAYEGVEFSADDFSCTAGN